MKTYYTKIHSSLIIKLIRIYCEKLENEIENLIIHFDDEDDIKNYNDCYKLYCDYINKLQNYREILKHSNDIDFIIIND